MKKLNLILGILTLAAIFAGLYYLKKEFLDPSPTTITSTAPNIEQLQELSELISTRVEISDILEGENDHFKGSWIIRGDALITTDLSQAEFSQINTTEHTATLTLPNPKITSARVDHNQTKTHNVSKKQWFVNSANESRLRDTAMKAAQKLIKKTANKPEHFTLAKTKTKNTIQSFYQQIDWKITIHWQQSSLQ